MRLESGLIIAGGILTASILYLVYVSPDDTLYYSSFQNPKFEHVADDYHLEPIMDDKGHWATISNITPIDDQTIDIVFRGNNPNGNNTMTDYGIPNDFEYSHLVKKGQVFIPVCKKDGVIQNNIKQDYVVFLQYMGVVQLNGTYYYEFYHTNAILSEGLVCKYPQIIQYSFNANYDIDYHATHPFDIIGKGLLIGKSSDEIVSVDNPCEILKCEFSK